MQEALPYKTWTIFPQHNPHAQSSPSNHKIKSPIPKGHVRDMVSENAVIVLGKRGCCMSHVVKRLLQGLGVNPAVYEVEEDDEDVVLDELAMPGAADGKVGRLQFPAVFIGGLLFGGLDTIMGAHISGELVPVLKQAGALWL